MHCFLRELGTSKMMRIRSLYMHISRSSINASRTGRVCAMRLFFFFVRGGGGEVQTGYPHFSTARKNTERDV